MTRIAFTGLAAALLIATLPVAAPASAQAISAEIDLLEVHLGKGDDHLVLDSTITAFDGPDHLVLKLEAGSDTRTQFDELTVQALYARELSETVQVMAGFRQDSAT